MKMINKLIGLLETGLKLYKILKKKEKKGYLFKSRNFKMFWKMKKKGF